jgi:mersacidin/lichenicidin family type 2 lantibiotic
MSNKDIIRSWKDIRFRNSLNNVDLANLPKNPAGIAEISEEELATVNGGWSWDNNCPITSLTNCRTLFYGNCATSDIFTLGCCGA